MSEGLFKIKTIAARVGVSPSLLRAWELRYGFLRPVRQSGNHRLYSQEDLQLLQRVCQLLREGLSIGEIAALGRETLLSQVIPSSGLLDISLSLRRTLLDLAPLDLDVHCLPRYGGELLGVSLHCLEPADLATVHRLYQVVKGIYEIWTYMEHRTVADVLRERLQRLRDPDLLHNVRVLGTGASPADPLLRHALESCRGGALRLLLQQEVEDLPLLLTLARDHAKMMRNAFFDLDAPLRRADESLKAHDLEPILRKVARLGRGVRVGASYTGAVSCRCLETSALDRVLYDFLARAEGPEVCALWVLQVNKRLTRWAFEWPGPIVRAPVPEELSALAVGMACGVTPARALEAGYLGTVQRGGTAWAWFHWPLYEPPPDVPQCLCHPLDGVD